MRIPQFELTRQHAAIADELDEAYRRVRDSGQYILGPEVERFEARFSSWLSVGEVDVVSCASGTDALQLALWALNVGPKDDVVAPAFTFVASATAAMFLGASVTLADVDPETFTVTPASVRAALTPRTKAVVVVHLYGSPADVPGIRAELDEHGFSHVRIVEDCAQSLGASVNGRATGTMGDLGCFSFFPTKVLGCLGDGGAVTTSDERLAERVRMLRAHGSKTKYEHELLGRNSRLDAMQAAFLDVKLSHLHEYVAGRARVAALYNGVLGETNLQLPVVKPGCTPSWGQYTVLTLERDAVRAKLREVGIDATVHYPKTLYEQPFWGYSRGQFETTLPGAAMLARQVLCLPVFPEMTDDEVLDVAKELQNALAATALV